MKKFVTNHKYHLHNNLERTLQHVRVRKGEIGEMQACHTRLCTGSQLELFKGYVRSPCTQPDC